MIPPAGRRPARVPMPARNRPPVGAYRDARDARLARPRRPQAASTGLEAPRPTPGSSRPRTRLRGIQWPPRGSTPPGRFRGDARGAAGAGVGAGSRRGEEEGAITRWGTGQDRKGGGGVPAIRCPAGSPLSVRGQNRIFENQWHSLGRRSGVRFSYFSTPCPVLSEHEPTDRTADAVSSSDGRSASAVEGVAGG